MKYVTGKSDDELFCKGNITGGDMFNAKTTKTINNVDEFLLPCYEKYLQTNYRDKFDWIDNIKQVKSQSEIEILNELLLQKINSNDECVFMAIPEVVDWVEINYFKYSGNNNFHNDIELTAFINTFDNNTIISFEQLKNKQIRAYSDMDENEPQKVWSSNKCIFANFDYDNNSYVFNGGNWYEINNDFQQEIINCYNQIPLSRINFINYSHGDEDEYNSALMQSLDNSMVDHLFCRTCLIKPLYQARRLRIILFG